MHAHTYTHTLTHPLFHTHTHTHTHTHSPASFAKTVKGPTGRIYATINPPPQYTELGPDPPRKDTRVNDSTRNVAHPWKPNRCIRM